MSMLYYHLVAADGIIPNIDPAAQKKKHKMNNKFYLQWQHYNKHVYVINSDQLTYNYNIAWNISVLFTDI